MIDDGVRAALARLRLRGVRVRATDDTPGLVTVEVMAWTARAFAGKWSAVLAALAVGTDDWELSAHADLRRGVVRLNQSARDATARGALS